MNEKMDTPDELTKKKFAELNGWSPSYVTKLGKAGRLVLNATGKKVLVKASLARIEETRYMDRDDVSDRHKKNRKGNTNNEKPVSTKFENLADARARKESFLAREAEMDYLKKAGQLCEIARVNHIAGEAGAIVQTVVSQNLDRFEVDADLDEKQSKLLAEYRDNMLHSIANQVSGLLAKLKDQQGSE